MATQAEIDAAFVAARERWQRLEATTVRRIRSSYRRATRALEEQILRTTGPVTRAHLQALLEGLNAMTAALDVDTLAALQRGITTAVNQATLETWSQSAGLAPLVGSARIRGLLQGTAEAETLAWMSRVGADGLQLSGRVWRAGQTYRRDVERVLENAVITGRSARETARMLEDYVQPGRQTAHRVETARQLGISRNTSYPATRLARTEINNAGREATIMANRTSPFYRGVRWRRSNVPYPCVICDELQAGTSDRAPGGQPGGFYPKGSEPTPAASHPQCRCVVLPEYAEAEDVSRRLADWLADPSSDPELEQYFGTAQAAGRPGLEAS